MTQENWRRSDYELLDSGDGRKLERFGQYSLIRPCSQAIWRIRRESTLWDSAAASFSRDGGNRWDRRDDLPDRWHIELDGIQCIISPTDFGHLGIFPEHATHWSWLRNLVRKQKPASVLNLFAYSGAATLVLAREEVPVTHLDSSKGMVSWARENAALNDLNSAPVRWIVDDAVAFMKREQRRGTFYDGIILDPPSFGRGNKGQVFKIERDLSDLLDICVATLSRNASFLLLTAHTPGITPLVMENMIRGDLAERGGSFESGEMTIPASNSLPLPSGTFSRWWRDV